MVQSLWFRTEITFFFDITTLLYQNQNPVNQMVDGRQFCSSLTYKHMTACNRSKRLNTDLFLTLHLKENVGKVNVDVSVLPGVNRETGYILFQLYFSRCKIHSYFSKSSFPSNVLQSCGVSDVGPASPIHFILRDSFRRGRFPFIKTFMFVYIITSGRD